MATEIRIQAGATGCGIRRLVLNGQELAGDLVPIALTRDVNLVEVRLD